MPIARVHYDTILCSPDSANLVLCGRQRAYAPEHAAEGSALGTSGLPAKYTMYERSSALLEALLVRLVLD